MGSMNAGASQDPFRIVEASFQTDAPSGAPLLASENTAPSTGAALPPQSDLDSDLATLQSRLRARGPAQALAPEVVVPTIGRIEGEILELRVLFKRLADVAELYDGEFDLDLEAAIEEGTTDLSVDLPELEQPIEQEAPLGDPGDDVSQLEQLSVSDALDVLTLSIAQLDHISEQTERMKSIFLDRSSAHDRRITEWPLQGGRVTSHFGHRVHPISGIRQLHRGMDFAAAIGTPVLAMADGIVAFSGPNGSYGNLVELEHGDGYRTRYAHNETNTVEAGQRVLKGQQIATLGSTGRSTGPHLHVEVRREGTPLDPAIFLR